MSSYSASTAQRRGSVVPPLSGVDKPDSNDLPQKCDILISGTGIVESILSAALAWQGSNVIQIDPGNHYGDSSSILNIEELKTWVNTVNCTSSLLFLFFFFFLSLTLPLWM
jgi:RAB protein geranylgeranyltransferase component A